MRFLLPEPDRNPSRGDQDDHDCRAGSMHIASSAENPELSGSEHEFEDGEILEKLTSLDRVRSPSAINVSEDKGAISRTSTACSSLSDRRESQVDRLAASEAENNETAAAQGNSDRGHVLIDSTSRDQNLANIQLQYADKGMQTHNPHSTYGYSLLWLTMRQRYI